MRVAPTADDHLRHLNNNYIDNGLWYISNGTKRVAGRAKVGLWLRLGLRLGLGLGLGLAPQFWTIASTVDGGDDYPHWALPAFPNWEIWLLPIEHNATRVSFLAVIGNKTDSTSFFVKQEMRIIATTRLFIWASDVYLWIICNHRKFATAFHYVRAIFIILII